MIRYQLIDENNNTWNLDDNTFRLLDDTSNIEADIIERTFTAGADFPGIQRDQSKVLTFNYSVNKPTDAEFRAVRNEQRFWFRKTRKIRDIILNTEVSAILESDSFQYDDGGFLRGGQGSVSFRLLKPFWQDVDWIVESDTGLSSGFMTINNTGYIETPPYITVIALEDVPKFSVRVLETGNGFLLRDLQFSSDALNTYIIDCDEGTAELNGISREDQFQAGTGFFNLQVGTNTLEIASRGQISIEIKWKRRYYV